MTTEELIKEIPKLSHEELIERMLAAYFHFKERSRRMELDGLPDLVEECNLYKMELLNRLNNRPSATFFDGRF